MILSNQARCKKCGDTPFSRHRHDFRSCKCGAIAVDGGTEYLRRLANDLSDIESMSIEFPAAAGEAAMAVCEDARKKGETPAQMSARMLDAITRNGVRLSMEDTSEEAYHAMLQASVEGLEWAAANGRNSFGYLCAMARRVRDAGGIWTTLDA